MSTPTSEYAVSSQVVVPGTYIPGLEAGDELSRDEFERRYEAMPEVKKAELIEGIVYMSSPVSLARHGEPEFDLGVWLGLYAWATPGVHGGHNSTVRLDLKNEPQPDLLLYIDPKCGGRVRLSNKGMVEGSPELIAEIAASSVSIDMNAKLRAYHRNQVQEYLVWRVNDQAIDWFQLVESEYVRIQPDSAGVLQSVIFPGLWLDAAALLRRDLDSVRKVLDAGLAHPSHQAFLKSLAAKSPTRQDERR